MAKPRIIVNSFASNSRSLHPKHKHAIPRTTQAKNKPRWVENVPSYVDDIRAGLATLTEEQKDAIHESLQG